MSGGQPRVKNKAVAPIQITAEQLLRESFDRRESGPVAPKHRIADEEELNEYRARTRKGFEDRIRRNPLNSQTYIKYAAWEVEQSEYARARSVLERAIEADPSQVAVWVRYIDIEMKGRNINHARNLCDRAVTVLPRVDKLWYKYVYMEETLGNVEGTREVFERWMRWEPDEQAWTAYVNFERRYKEVAKARRIFERYTFVHPGARNWLKWAAFEQDEGDADTTRHVYTLAIDTLGNELMDERIFAAYARFEASLKEFERARAIFTYALDRLPRSGSRTLYNDYTRFQKQHGDKNDIEDAVSARRRQEYELALKTDADDLDIWFDYVSMEESRQEARSDRVRDIYSRATARVPHASKKDDQWRKYIFLWLYWALFEESIDDLDAARARYEAALATHTGRDWTFAKLWDAYARFEIRRGDIALARKLFSRAIEEHPMKDGLYKRQISLEVELRSFDACRGLYERLIESNPANTESWVAFAQLESELGDDDRARAIFELAISRDELDLPEAAWKAYIDYELDNGLYDKVRALYERLLVRTQHAKVWIAFAKFELALTETDDAEKRCRDIFIRGDESFKERSHEFADEDETDPEEKDDYNDQRVLLLQTWLSFERQHGSNQEIEKVEKLQGRKVKRQRRTSSGMEEFYDYVFPSADATDAKASGLLNMLAAARAWKAAQTGRQAQENPDTNSRETEDDVRVHKGLVHYDHNENGNEDTRNDDDDEDEEW
ncbi:NineTeen Complex (NTC) component [Savitreella phatthalungensis]